MASTLRYKGMKLTSIIWILLAILVVNLSFTFAGGPGPKKVYRDTIYRYGSKSKPVVPSTPVVKNKPVAVPAVPKLPEVAEEDRIIAITADIKKFVVKKSLQKMYVYFADTFKVFRISLGANPQGHKQKQGDNKTPEGKYSITYKNPQSRGHRSLKISYPNDDDRENASKAGVNPGGDIFIHGLWWPSQDPNSHWKDNWTSGCIAVNNSEIEEIFDHTVTNTEIIIQP